MSLLVRFVRSCDKMLKDLSWDTRVWGMDLSRAQADTTLSGWSEYCGIRYCRARTRL